MVEKTRRGAKRLKKSAALAPVVYLIVYMVIAPQSCVESARYGLRLCAETVVPSLFPFFVVSSLFMSLGAGELAGRYLSRIMKPIFGVSGAGAIAFVVGIISGYPVGASCAVRLNNSGALAKTESERLLAFCNNSGPMFCIAAVGVGMLYSSNIGLILYLIHILSAMLTGAIFKFYKSDSADCCTAPGHSGLTRSKSISGFSAAIGSAVTDSVKTMLKVCGFVVIFSVVCGAIPRFTGAEFLYSLLEITYGVKTLVPLDIAPALKLSLINMFISISGVSVLFQVSAIVSDSNISLKPYILGKLLQGALAFNLSLITFGALDSLGLLDRFAAVFNSFGYGAPPALEPPQLLKLGAFAAAYCAISILALCLIARIIEASSDIKRIFKRIIARFGL